MTRHPRRPEHPAVIALADCWRGGLMLLLLNLLANAPSAWADEQQDRAMRKISSDSGCSFCHNEEARKPGTDELLPVAPSWKDIARRYRGQRDAETRLTNVVMTGSGKGDSGRHWAYKVRDTRMPANTVEISQDDARRLVRWILSLK